MSRPEQTLRADSGHRQRSGMGQSPCQGGLLHLGSARAHSLSRFSSKPDRLRSMKIPPCQVKAVVEEEPKLLNMRATFTTPVLLPDASAAFSKQQEQSQWHCRSPGSLPMENHGISHTAMENHGISHTQLKKGKLQATHRELPTSVNCTLPSFFLCKCLQPLIFWRISGLMAHYVTMPKGTYSTTST